MRDSDEAAVGFEVGRCMELSPQQPGSGTPIAAVIPPVTSVIATVTPVVLAVIAPVTPVIAPVATPLATSE